MKQRLAKILFNWEEEINFRPKWYAIFFNPYFIARRAILQHVQNFAKNNSRSKKILDVGCGVKPYEKFFPGTYLGIDIEGGGHGRSHKQADKFYDGEYIPYPEKEFDLVISTQVLEHALNLNGLMKEISRVLVPGGTFFLTVPLVWDEHEIPYDFRRFTKFGLLKLLKENNFKARSISPTTGIFATTGQLFSAFLSEGFANLVEKLPVKFRLKYPLNKLFIFLICFPVQFIALLLDFMFLKKGITLDYAVIAQKNHG